MSVKTKTAVKDNTYYTIRETWDDSPATAYIGRYSTPEDAADDIKEMNEEKRGSSKTKRDIIKKTIIITTITQVDEEVIPAP